MARKLSRNTLLVLAGVALVILIILLVTGILARLMVIGGLVALITAIVAMRTKKPTWLKFTSSTVARNTAIGAGAAMVIGSALVGVQSPTIAVPEATATVQQQPGGNSPFTPRESTWTAVTPTSAPVPFAESIEPTAKPVVPTPTAEPVVVAPEPEPVAAAPAPEPAPAPAPEPAPAPVAEPAPAPAPPPVSVYFKNCDAARAAGAAPVHAGDPGYGGHLDRDGDGVGCES